MEMRIVAPDAADAGALAERLTLVVGAERASLPGDHQERWTSVSSMDPIEPSCTSLTRSSGGFERASVGSAEIWLGDRSYRLAGWVPVETWQ